MSSKGSQLGLCLRNGIMAMTMLGVYGMTSVAEAQQSSLVLKNSDMNFCYRQQNEWTLTKTNDAVSQPVASDTLVTWTVTATKTTSEVNEICAVGYVSVTNGGSAPATIGNIVVNLQRKNGPKWVSASVDVANATNGDAATSVNIVANASQELSPGPTYVISGAKGTFTENSASGLIEFTDADNNTIWAITPQQTIPAGQTVNLFFKASFNNTILGIPSGESLRTEVIVSFGNAGGRGAGGASASNIDVNGNGAVDADEANVRSVPTRVTRNLPALDKCNDTVQLSDTLSTTGASYSNVNDPSGLLTGLAISSTGSYQLSATVSGTGTVTNTVSLKGTDTFVTVQVPTGQVDELGNPIFAPVQIPCCVGADLTASSSVDVTETTGFNPGDYCTVTQGGYQGGGVPGQAYDNNFILTFTPPGYMDVGSYFPSNGNTAPNGARWEANATGRSSLKTFLAGGGPSGKITVDVLNGPSISGGALTKQTATLTLTVAFSNGTIWPSGFGSVVYHNTSDALDGATVSQILTAANQALAGSGLPSGYSFSSLNELITNLNEAFDNNHGTKQCEASAWASEHLTK
ncbi:MAG: hypothetical protein MRJ66_07940 [Nitrospira sp.]|nr:hypothetical protein [Nitrospira sp.]